MSDTKIFSFGENGGGVSANSIAAMLPALLQNRGIDSGYLMGLLNGGGNNGGFFGNNGGFQDIIALIVIAAIFGNGNFGFGNNGNNRGSEEGREMIMQTLNRNGLDIATLAQSVGTSSDKILAGINSVSSAICSLGNQTSQSFNQVLTAMLQGNNALTSQIASCCCDLKGLIASLNTGMERGFSTIAFNDERNKCDIVNSIKESTAQILQGQRDAVTREMQNKIDALREENSTFKASAMTSGIVSQATAPLATALADLSARLAKIECKTPETVTIPYSPVVGVPSCIAAQYGFGFGLNGSTGFWG